MFCKTTRSGLKEIKEGNRGWQEKVVTLTSAPVAVTRHLRAAAQEKGWFCARVDIMHFRNAKAVGASHSCSHPTIRSREGLS